MQMYATMEGVGFVFTHEERVAKLNALRESVEANADKSQFAGAKRIMVTGQYMAHTATMYSNYFDAKTVLNSLRGNVPQS